MDYQRLYEQDGDGSAGATGATTVGNSGLGMSSAERASVPSYKSRKKKKKAGVNTLMRPAAMNTAPEP